jgi:uncharacterized membrane protein
MTEIEHSVLINRSVEDVFTFMSNPENGPLWAGVVRESNLTSEGPFGLGSTYSRVVEILGRRIESSVEVTEYETNSKISTKTTSGPMLQEDSMTLKAFEGGTELTVAAKVEVAGLLKLAEPVFGRMANRQVETDFANLKDLLEARAYESD